MVENLYKTMERLMQEQNHSQNAEIRYIGKISMYESQDLATITNDIFVMIDVTSDGRVIKKYYDTNQNFIAGRGTDGELFPSQKYMNDDLGFLNEIDNIDNENGISLEELDKMLAKISNSLNISKNEILSMTEIELDTLIKEQDTTNLSLSEDDQNTFQDQKEVQKHNNEILDNINSKQEVTLDKKIDNEHTLYEILGVDAGSTLITVESNEIQGNKNTTRFTCIIKSPDGSLHNANILHQIGGKDSDLNIYESSKEGDITQKDVKSSYSINSHVVEHGIITINHGDMGAIEIAYGEQDKTSHKDALTQRLETKTLYQSNSEVRDGFSAKNGTDNIPRKMDTLHDLDENGHKKTSMSEIGNIPIDANDAAELILQNEQYGRSIEDIFTKKEIAERFIDVCSRHHGSDTNVLIEITTEELATDASYYHNH